MPSQIAMPPIGGAILAIAPLLFVQKVPLKMDNSPAPELQSVHHTCKPAAEVAGSIAFLSVKVILGIKNPLEVETNSNCADPVAVLAPITIGLVPPVVLLP